MFPSVCTHATRKEEIEVVCSLLLLGGTFLGNLLSKNYGVLFDIIRYERSVILARNLQSLNT